MLSIAGLSPSEINFQFLYIDLKALTNNFHIILLLQKLFSSLHNSQKLHTKLQLLVNCVQQRFKFCTNFAFPNISHSQINEQTCPTGTEIQNEK